MNSDFDDLVQTLRHMRVVALTGAGCSTESGIPDYRGEETRRRARNPMTFQEFTRSVESRQRYWARSALGWPRIRDARPNDAHHALAAMEVAGTLRGIITQNVDRLHATAGSARIVELHGALADVRCLGCGCIEGRDEVQARMTLHNQLSAEPRDFAPDGDADVSVSAERDFVVPTCVQCGGDLKPDVVFFGENVPGPIVDAAWSMMAEAEALLVVGSSLAVYSGFRFVKWAAERRLPIAVMNRGETRGDDLAWVKVEDNVALTLPKLAAALGAKQT